MSDPVMPAHPDGTPTRLGRYRLVRPISTGGMARVFEGRRESLAGVAPRVAVKVILPDFAGEERFRALFINEARIGSMLQHQNLVQIQDFDCEQGVYYLVMEYVEGLTLRRCMSLARRNDRTIPPEVIAELGRQVCEGLHHAHGARSEDGAPLLLVHRDIKPSNLILNPQGVVKILDFGISKAVLTEERRGAVRGTWGYMAPEQAAGEEVGPAADLFGVASVLYELAALRPLFPEKGEDEIRALLANDEGARRATRLMGSTGALASILVRALQRDPAARYQTAAEMGRALGGLLPDPVTAREAVERFQADVAQLDGSVPSAPIRAAVGAPPGQGVVNPLALPVAAGESPRELPLGPLSLVTNGTGHPGSGYESQPRSLLAPATDDAGGWRTATTALFVLIALVIIGFTGWRLVDRPASGPAVIPPAVRITSPESVVPDPSAESLSELEEAAAPEDIETRPTPAPVPVPVPVPAPPKKASPPKRSPAPARPPPTSSKKPPAETTPAQVGRGLITISSIPKAQVIVDGKFIRNSPLYRFDVAAGTRVVTLIDPEGRRKTFSVPVTANGEIRRVWSFDEDRFISD